METDDKDRVEQWLDSALRQYASAEPRAGLEGRILANLGAQSVRRQRWAFAWVAVAAASVLIAAIWSGSILRHRRQEIANSVRTLAAVQTETPPLNPGPMPSAKTHLQARRRSRAALNKSREVARNTPRLGQFPSARPLSEQERLLVAYVDEYPKEAAEVAKEQTEREKELEAMYPLANPESKSTQER